MKRMQLLATLVIVLAVIASCTPSPVVPPPEGGDGAAPAEQPDAMPRVDASFDGAATWTPPTGWHPPSLNASDACEAMRVAGCAEGAEPHCDWTLQHTVDSRISMKLDVSSLACLTGAKTKAAVRACGGVVCQ